MSRLRARTASVGNRSDLQNTPALGIVPLRPSPAPATIVQNLAASLIGNIQEDIRCACHIGKNLYTGDNQGTMLRWNPSDASRVTFVDGLGAPVNVVVGVNDDKVIWAGLANGNITILSLETQGIKSQIIHAHDAAVNCIAAGIQCAWSGGDDFLIKKWDMEGVELFTYNHHHGFIKDLLLLRNDPPADSQVRLWGASSDETLSLAALQDNRAQHTLLSDVKMLSDHSKGVLALCLVGADSIWSGFEDGSISVWSSLGVLKRQLPQAHKGPVGSFVVMGGHVWSGSGDRTVLVWESSSFQLLFSLGDHGGFVKAMVRVEYMCWIFASGKNVRIWCAQSVWDSHESEKDRLNRTIQKLKESLEKAQRDKQSLESTGKQSQQDLQVAQKQLNEQRIKGASALEKRNAEIEKLKNELAKTLDDLEVAKEKGEQNAGSLDQEIKTLAEKLSKLKAEKEAGDKVAKAKVEGLEKGLDELGKEHKKALEDLAALKSALENVKTDLQTSQGDLENSRKNQEDLVAKHSLEDKRAAELEKSLKVAEDRNLNLQNDLARSIKDNEDAKAGCEEERAQSQERIKQLQEDLDRAQENANSTLTAKDAELQKLQGELKKKIKELKKALKDAGEEKKRSAKELEELKEITEQLKKGQDASSSAEASNNEKLASLALELQSARDDLLEALSDNAESLAERDMAMEKMSEDHLKSVNDLQQALKEIQAENEKLQGFIKESEQNAGASKEAYEEACGALDELRNAVGKGLKDLQESEQKRADLEKTTVSEQKKHSEEVDKISDGINNLTKEKTMLEGLLAQASAEMEKLRAEKTFQEDRTAQNFQELDQLNRDKEELEKKLAQKAAELEHVGHELDQIKKDKADLQQELNQIRNDKETIKGKIAVKSAELEEALQQKSSQQDTITKMTKEIEELKAQKGLSEDKISALVREIEELKKAKRSQEELAKQKAAEFDQMVREMERLLFDIKEKENEHRFAKESAMLAASDAAQKIDELQNKKARLELKLEVAQAKAQAATSVDDPVWARIRELETALMQAHMDYRLLTQEVRRLRKRRERRSDTQTTTAGIRPPCQADGLDLALKIMQPGFCIDYTKLKVSSGGNEGRVEKNIEVYGQTSHTETPRKLIPIRPPVSYSETPQRIVPIRTPSPAPEMIEPVVTSRPQSIEKERYFPSHGPMRVRRGLSPGRQQ